MGGEALCRPLLLTNSETMKGNSPLFGYLGVRLEKRSESRPRQANQPKLRLESRYGRRLAPMAFRGAE